MQTASPSRLPFLSQGERDCWRFLTRTRLEQAQLLLPPASSAGAQLEAPQLPELRQDPQEPGPQHLGHLPSLLPQSDNVVTYLGQVEDSQAGQGHHLHQPHHGAHLGTHIM